MYEYYTKRTCSTKIRFEIKDGKLYSVDFEDGCEGNLKALCTLVEGMNAQEVVQKLKGLCCGRRETSCADQLARAIEANL